MSGSTAREIADVVLLSLFSQDATSALIESTRGTPAKVVVERSQQVIARAVLEPEIANAVVARLALLAELDPVDPASQLGRSAVRVDGVIYHVLVTTHRAGDASRCEVRLLEAVGDRQPGELRGGSRIGPYKILESLGRGGMGAVYLVEHKQLQKRFAMKVLLRSVFEEDPDAAARFVCEARAAARGKHPGIINVSDFGSLPDGRAFLVMELLSGRSVADLLTAGGALDPARALRLIAGAADALSAAHRVGVIHRDLTPSNMFVESEPDGRERLVLVDFGAAKMTDVELADAAGSPRAKVVFGTPYYMAPEHAQGRPTDARTDIYALGCCLFEMLTGQVPYHAHSVREILLKHILDPVPELSGPAAELPKLPALVRRMLAKRAADRHQSAAELADELQRCLEAVT